MGAGPVVRGRGARRRRGRYDYGREGVLAPEGIGHDDRLGAVKAPSGRRRSRPKTGHRRRQRSAGRTGAAHIGGRHEVIAVLVLTGAGLVVRVVVVVVVVKATLGHTITVGLAAVIVNAAVVWAMRTVSAGER